LLWRQKLLVTYNPAEAMKGLIKKPASKSYQPIKAHEIGDFIAAVNASGAHMGTKLAVHFLLLTAVRKDNVCKARWEHLDMEAKTWTIPARTTGGNGFMKMQHPHTVYLSRQALDILKQARWLSGYLAIWLSGYLAIWQF
jgi:integrase